ncbi:allantoicase [Frateuria defendens]|uniref:allantoicase n=1 Tax=Frateuria defendens TaxID=2219559 RepID=UPI00066FEDC9|nr:allantoicase [Frateuria defendens]
MTLTATAPDAPAFARLGVNLADARLGAQALVASDDFFAAKERMLDPAPAVFIPGKYDDNGKWMDGWESRRRRHGGHDWCIVRLARPGRLYGVDLDTSHFTGNYPPGAALEGCLLAGGEPDADTAWTPLLPAVELGPDRHHYHAIADEGTYSHLRVNIYPDGGLARLRVYGRPSFDAQLTDAHGRVDLAAAIQGARGVAANNEHYGHVGNLLMPGRGVDMGDGWETRRRREPGHDWCLIALAVPGAIEAVEVDTAHFKGNFPDRCSLQAAFAPGVPDQALITQSMFWAELLPAQALAADSLHRFAAEVQALGPVTHVRFNIHPDGGVSRLRLFGRPT